MAELEKEKEKEQLALGEENLEQVSGGAVAYKNVTIELENALEDESPVKLDGIKECKAALQIITSIEPLVK